MRVSRQRLAKKGFRLLQNQPRQKVIRMLAAELINSKRTAELDLLLRDIAREQFMQSGHLEVAVRSARPIDISLQSLMTDKLKAISGAKSIGISYEIDPHLIGGCVIDAPDFTLDLSIAKVIRQLEDSV
jgi:F0F1-type ATP synthase delta subunit